MKRNGAHEIDWLVPRLRRTRWPVQVGQYARLAGTELQRRWAEFLGRIPWEMFATLTFDERRVYPVPCELAHRELLWWCGLVGRLCRRPVGWAYAVERGVSGMWHGHALLIGVGKVSWDVPAGNWRVRNGLADIRPVRDVPGISLYTSKSVARDGKVVLADTLPKYTRRVVPDLVVPLFPNGD